jgi:hypothetical protein
MPNQKLFVISRRCGRLANRLVLFANFIALAEEHGWQVSNVTFHSYAAFFKTTRGDIYCRYPSAKRQSWLDLIPGVAALIRKTRIFNSAIGLACRGYEHLPLFGKSIVTLMEPPGYEVIFLEDERVQNRIRDARIVFIYGWRFRAPNLVRRHAQKIRDYFEPVEKYEALSSELIGRLRRDSDIVIGVHIRQGDYRHWLGGRYFFPASQYAAWMHQLAAQFPGRRASFFICSNEPRHEREFPSLRVGFGGSSPLADLCALSKCDYIVGPVSTFSQWASFYGQKPLLHFNDRSETVHLEKFHVSDLNYIK